MKVLFLVSAMLFWGNPIDAQRHDVVTGSHGGILQEVADLQVELLVGDRTVTLYAYSRADVALEIQNYNASVVIVSGANHELVQLQAIDEFRLEDSSTDLLRPYSSLTLHITAPTGLAGTVAF